MKGKKHKTSKKVEEKDRAKAEKGSSRRSFFAKLMIVLGVVALGEFIAMVAAYLGPRKTRAKAGDFGAVIEAGPVENFSPDSVTAFVRGKFYLVRLDDGGFLALSRRCTHLGCTVPWLSEEKKFLCPCHASAFDIRGDVINPPAPRSLDIYRVFIENDTVKVDTGKSIKRSQFRPEQVTYEK